MDILILESFSFPPHLETAGEICIRESFSQRDIGFCFLHSENPDDIRHINSKIAKLAGISYRVRVKKLQRILNQFSVNIIEEPCINKIILDRIRGFSKEIPVNLVDLYDYKYRDAKIGLGTASSLISRIKSIDPDLDLHSKIIEKYLYSAALIYEKSLCILSQLRPKKVITFNGRFACSKAIAEAANYLNIPVAYHERGSRYDRFNIFCKSPHDHSFWQESIKLYWENGDDDKYKIGHTYFKNRRNGDGIGWVSFTENQHRNLLPPRLGRRNLVYYTTTEDEFYAVDCNNSHQYLFNDQREAVSTLVSWMSRQDDDTFLTIRIHPNMKNFDSKDLNWWYGLTSNNVQVISPESEVDSYGLLDYADIVLSCGSSMGVEATYWGKPSIILSNCRQFSLGCSYEPKCVSELFNTIEKNDLKPLPQESCLPYGYYMISFGEQYQYYQPQNLFSGYFCGQRLSSLPAWFTYRNRDLFYIKKLISEYATTQRLFGKSES
jgi:hypothetical protein